MMNSNNINKINKMNLLFILILLMKITTDKGQNKSIDKIVNGSFISSKLILLYNFSVRLV